MVINSLPPVYIGTISSHTRTIAIKRNKCCYIHKWLDGVERATGGTCESRVTTDTTAMATQSPSIFKRHPPSIVLYDLYRDTTSCDDTMSRKRKHGSGNDKTSTSKKPLLGDENVKRSDLGPQEISTTVYPSFSLRFSALPLQAQRFRINYASPKLLFLSPTRQDKPQPVTGLSYRLLRGLHAEVPGPIK